MLCIHGSPSIPQRITNRHRDEILVLDAEAAHRATQEVAATHGIPTSRSADLQALPPSSPSPSDSGVGVGFGVGAEVQALH